MSAISTKPINRAVGTIVAALALSLVVAGCGASGKSADASGSPTSSTTPTASATTALPTTLTPADCQNLAAPLPNIQKAIAGFGQTTTSADLAKALAAGSAQWNAVGATVSGPPAVWLKSMSNSADQFGAKLLAKDTTGLTPIITALAGGFKQFTTFCP